MEQKIKILVVEDEMIIAAKTAMYLTELGYEVTAILPRGEEAVPHVRDHRPDLALLDVRLQSAMDGITVSELLRGEFNLPVIFLTANADDETFSRAKDTKPFAFLQKPFRKTELKRTLELAIAQMERESHEDAEPAKPKEENAYLLEDRILVRYNDKMIKLMFADILRIEAERSYCHLVTKEKDYLLTMPMKRLEDKLPEAFFQRIHRSHIVHLHHVDEVTDGQVRIGGKLLPLSSSNRDDFLRRFRVA